MLMKKLNRRRLLATALGAGSMAPALDGTPQREPSSSATTATDFARSFLYYVPRSTSLWVRIQIECRCQIIDVASGAADEYVLGVRTQTGLRTEPPSEHLDPGYDFWLIFSRRSIFIRRVHPSWYNDNSSRVPVGEFVESGWRLEPCPAAPLRTGAEIEAALRAWRVVVARTEFASRDRARRYIIDYPVKWADGNPDGTFRVETGPVLMLDPDRIQVGNLLQLTDFRWAYLDYRSFDQVRCLLERPTSILTGSTYKASAFSPRRNPALTTEQVARIEERLYQGWTPPIPAEALRQLFQTDHYSETVKLAARTTLYALMPSSASGRRA